jgi:hypothetical protein
MSNRSWSDEQLKSAIQTSKSVRSVLLKLGLVPAGGNYEQIKKHMSLLDIDSSHFTGKAWNQGSDFRTVVAARPIEEILSINSNYQSYKLKKRLIKTGLKKAQCEMCGWNKRSIDGRIPIELDHINGIKSDNRLSNLRILCPNCHSLQLTHRGLNKTKKYIGGTERI